MRRLFVGLPLSPALRKRLAQKTLALPKAIALLTAPENLHVTLLFLGCVREAEVPDVCRRVGEVCRNTRAFELTFTRMELVPDPELPRMLWLTGEGSEPLRKLREEMEKAFDAFITEKKIYRPHVTLAKIKKVRWLALPKKPMVSDRVAFVESMETVAVFESFSLAGKRRYEPIDTFHLG